jgi:hemolysin III
MVQGYGTVSKFLSLTVYGLSLIGMFSASATYHMVRVRAQTLEIFRKIDHSAIFLLIAGTYTPFCINFFTGFWKWGLLAIIWSLAIIGITVKIFVVRAPRWLNAGIYIVMGWLCVAAIGELVLLPAWILIWMIIGGVIYTLGALVYITKIFNFVPGVFGFHEVWHIFVMLGALAHFIAVFGLTF